MASNLLKVVLLQFSSTALTGTFQDFGLALTAPGINVNFYNKSTVDVYITDGVSNWQIPAGQSFIGTSVSPANNHSSSKIYFPTGAQLQVKQVTASGAGTNDIIAHITMER